MAGLFGWRSIILFQIVYPAQEVDLLLAKWDQAWTKLASAEGAYEASGCKRRPQHRVGCCGCWGALPATQPATPIVKHLPVCILQASLQAFDQPDAQIVSTLVPPQPQLCKQVVEHVACPARELCRHHNRPAGS